MINIIFVCTGNICRSPSGEGILKALVKDEGLENEFFIDSAGTDSYHVGEAADSRMQKHASKRGFSLTSRSRRLSRTDFDKFDYILAMDYSNFQRIKRMDSAGTFSGKIYMMNDFSSIYKGQDVPDPWYGGPDGFEEVLDMLEDSCRGLLDSVRVAHGL